MNPSRPLPRADALTEPFWRAVQEQRLECQRCNQCGAVRFPPARFCPECRSESSSWAPLSGTGRVYSWIVVRQPIPKEIFEHDVPYVMALIDLDEGIRMPSNIVDCAPESIVADMPVHVVFRKFGATLLPMFTPGAYPANPPSEA